MKKRYYLTAISTCPKIPFWQGVVIELCFIQFHIPEWLKGIIWFCYTIWVLAIIITLSRATYLDPFQDTSAFDGAIEKIRVREAQNQNHKPKDKTSFSSRIVELQKRKNGETPND
jgi:hypothetical protein